MKERIPTTNDVKLNFQFMIPSAFSDDGGFTMEHLETQFKKALKNYGVIDFTVTPVDAVYSTIIGTGRIACTPEQVDDLMIDLTLVSVFWRRGLLTVEGRTVWDGNRSIHGVPPIVLENLDRYLKLTGKKQP